MVAQGLDGTGGCSPAKAVVIYGSWRTAWKNFDRFTVNAHQHTNSITRCCADAFIATGWEIRNFTDAISSSNYTIGRTRRRKGRLEMFIEVSLEYMDRQCVDPRDKIYSLLGLYDPGKIRLYPDYTKEVSEVYTETFCRMIEEAEMSPQCLLGQGFNSEKFNLPSWVHDFSAVYDPRDRFWHAENAYPLYEACGDLPGKLEVKDRKELLLHGILIDRVKVVATETFTKPHRRCFENWPKTCDENGVPIRTNQAYEMFTRVMCGDIMKRTGGYERPSKENDIDLPTDDAWSEFWATGNRYIFPEQYRRIYTNVLRDKTLYVTTSGRVGLSFPYIKAGDEVWVIHGSNVPFILRRQSETPAHHRLVGDTYLHGVMHGSCARREDSVEVGLV
ncbi:hypothetical protein IG631_05053 [Alternaria alternata]|nr:hypothetical protein IG631_05053 [Alternaria alternata]